VIVFSSLVIVVRCQNIARAQGLLPSPSSTPKSFSFPHPRDHRGWVSFCLGGSALPRGLVGIRSFLSANPSSSRFGDLESPFIPRLPRLVPAPILPNSARINPPPKSDNNELAEEGEIGEETGTAEAKESTVPVGTDTASDGDDLEVENDAGEGSDDAEQDDEPDEPDEVVPQEAASALRAPVAPRLPELQLLAAMSQVCVS